MDYVSASVVDLYRQISALPDLRPCRHVNQLFTELVGLITRSSEEWAAGVLEHPDVRAVARDLRELGGRAEVELERDWSQRVAASPEPDVDLGRLPYLDNYRRLCRVECGLIEAALDEMPRSVAFIGCGSLPVTSLMLAQDLGCEVVNIDRDQCALDAATEVASSLGVPGILFANADAAAVDVSRFDVVVLAAMVGTTDREKRAILAHLRESMSPDSALMARGAQGLRTLLYPPIADDALAGFDVRAVVHPVSEVINSVILARPVR